MTRRQIDEVTEVVKDAAYVSVGLGVIVFQRLQVRRNELVRTMEGRTDEAKGAFDLVTALLSERMKLIEERMGAARDTTRR